MKFIHITDSHLLNKGELFHGFDTQRRFQLCIKNIRENHGDAYCIVVTGDITERGDAEAYRFFNEQMLKTGLPVYSTMGNHDDRKKYYSECVDEPPNPNNFVQSAIETPEGVFLVLDTKLEGSDAGTYCKIRQRWLLEHLKKYADEPVYIFMHHPPFDLGLPNIDSIGLDAKEAFTSILSTHNNVRHLFFGHAHRPVGGNWRGISFSSMSGTNHQSPLDFTGTGSEAVSDNPEYAIVLVSDNQIVVHAHQFMNDLD